VSSEAVVALHKIDPQGTEVVPVVNNMLMNKDDTVRWRGALAATLIGPPARGSMKRLLEALQKDSNTEVRRTAAGALAALQTGGAEMVSALSAALKDESKFVRMAAARALGDLGLAAQAALPALKFALKDADAEVRQYADAALKAIPSK